MLGIIIEMKVSKGKEEISVEVTELYLKGDLDRKRRGGELIFESWTDNGNKSGKENVIPELR